MLKHRKKVENCVPVSFTVDTPYIDAPIIIAISEYKGTPRIDIRHFWTPEGQSDLAPTKKGVNIPLEYAEDLYHALGEALRANHLLDE